MEHNLRRKNIERLVGENNVDYALSQIRSLVTNDQKYMIKTSSNKSLVIIFPDKTIKIFPKSISILPELTALSKINSRYVIKVVAFINEPNLKVIVYKTVIPLMEPPNNLTSLYKLLCDIAKALYDIHSHGYIHGDTGIGNIGTEGKHYVLYDFEDVEQDSSPEKRYTDVNNFLEDLRVRYKRLHSPLIKVINLIQSYMEIMFVNKEIVTRMVLGKQRRRTLKTYTYRIGSFKKLVNWIGNI